MNRIPLHILRFVGLILLQILIFGQIEFLGIHPMIYPLFVMLLPFSMQSVPLLFVAFIMGLTVDIFSNTGGLHASSLLIFAVFRPFVFTMFRPRDGYEQFQEASVYEMGQQWFLYSFGMLIVLHHTWFFFMEAFKWSDVFYTVRKIVLTLPITYISVILLQFLFLIRADKR